MSVSKPTILKDFIFYLREQDEVPFLVTNIVGLENSGVPEQFLGKEHLILNLNPRAVAHEDINGDCYAARMQFNGVMTTVMLPMERIEAVYGKGEHAPKLVFGKYIPEEQPVNKPDLRIVK